MPIAPTALLLNHTGRIYHLDLYPGELADTIILVGDPERVALVSEHFDQIEICKQHREFTVHTGTIGQRRLSVIGTGIGTGNVEIAITEADALHNIDFSSRIIKKELTSLQFIRLGTSGALQKDIPVDSFVLSDYAVAFDGLLNFYRYPYNEEEAALLGAIQHHFANFPVAAQAYATSASAPLSELFYDHCVRGTTLTTVGFYGPQHRQLRAPLIEDNIITTAQQFRYRDQTLTNFEMETAALFGMGHLLNHQCCSISAIVVNRFAETISQNSANTIRKMIEMALKILVKNN